MFNGFLLFILHSQTPEKKKKTVRTKCARTTATRFDAIKLNVLQWKRKRKKYKLVELTVDCDARKGMCEEYRVEYFCHEIIMKEKWNREHFISLATNNFYVLPTSERIKSLLERTMPFIDANRPNEWTLVDYFPVFSIIRFYWLSACRHSYDIQETHIYLRSFVAIFFFFLLELKM